MTATAAVRRARGRGERPLVLEIGDASWRAFVAGCEDRSPFHEPTWASVLARCYGHRAFVLAVTDDRGEIECGAPFLEAHVPLRGRRWIALPYTDACPPLLAAGAEPTAVTRLTRALEHTSGEARAAHVEVRAALPGDALCPHVRGVVHTLELAGDADGLFRTLGRGTRSNIRVAERSGVTVRTGTDAADIDAFYALHVRTRRRLGVPVQPRRFFRLLREELLSAGGGFVALGEQGGTPVAAAIFLTSGATIAYKYGASDPAAWPARPNNALFWHVIRTAAEQGYERLDFGRTDLRDHGLRAFKAAWGAREDLLLYSSTPRGARRSERALRACIRRAPESLCRTLGSTLYRWAVG